LEIFGEISGKISSLKSISKYQDIRVSEIGQIDQKQLQKSHQKSHSTASAIAIYPKGDVSGIALVVTIAKADLKHR
jgi:hypothetical protein